MKVSIITPTLNSARTIRNVMECIKDQTYANIEHIICDGVSQDNTLSIVNEYQDERNVKIVSEKDKGIYDAMNKGIQLATGDIIGILNSDDFYAYNQVIEEVVKVFQDSQTESVYGDLQYIHPDKNNKIVRYWRSGNFKKSKMLRGWMLPHPTFFIKKSVYDRFGLFHRHYKISGDYEMIIRLLYKNNISTQYLPKVLVKMRTGGASNGSLFNRVRAQVEDHKAWKDNGIDHKYYTVPLKPIRKIGQFVYPKLSMIF